MHATRRELCVLGSKLGGVLALGPLLGCRNAPQHPVKPPREEPLFRISLAQWSLHRMLYGGELGALGFPSLARDEFGIEAVEYVNSFFKDKATDYSWLHELRIRASDAGVRSLLIMVDGEGALADGSEVARRQAIHRHFKWIAAAAFLGCHSIRVNARGVGQWEDDRGRAADSLHQLAELGDDYGINVLVENHGGLSSNGKWLAEVMRAADHPRVGTLPDFGNFQLGDGKSYDRYQGVAELMPFARAVSAKSHRFGAGGQELDIDYPRMLRIVLGAGYRGHLGVEWEGDGVDEIQGTRLTLELLKRVRSELAREFS